MIAGDHCRIFNRNSGYSAVSGMTVPAGHGIGKGRHFTVVILFERVSFFT